MKENVKGALFATYLLAVLAGVVTFLAATRIKEAVVLAVAGILIAVFLRWGSAIELVRLWGLEVKLRNTVRETQQTLAETRELAKTLAEIAVSLAHHANGWTDTARATAQMKKAVIDRALGLQEKLGIALSEEILETHYVKTCGDYDNFIRNCLNGREQTAFYYEIGVVNIPVCIDDVPSPERIEEVLRKLNLRDDYMAERVEDYRYYRRTRRHRDSSRWDDRAYWQRPRSADQEG